ncbi:MAG: SLC13/DASS family transporter [Gammaproteobacteria bacterium]|nr:SLC13/DASS family transporter [Gammaproteobacteria bacterium]
MSLLLGPIVALLAGGLMWFSGGGSSQACLTLGITSWVIIWWMFEPIPIPATSLIPLALLPMFGVLTPKELGAAYGHPLVLLLMAGFLLATALEKSGAHRRIALAMVRLFGGSSSKRLVFGFMSASAVLSMWISNTATVLMLLPVAIAVLDSSDDPMLSTPLLLGIAYGASIGGMGTPIGTPPNVVFMGVYEQVTGATIAFSTWMSWAIPIVLVLLPIAGFWITRKLTHEGYVALPSVGEWRTSERRVFIIFAVTAFCWVTRTEPFGGWSTWLQVPYTNDAIVGFLGVIALFLIPNGEGDKLLDWETANKIPWGMLILFGAGISIASAFMNSGLSTSIGQNLEQLSTLHLLVMIGIICFSVTFLTEVTSNTATTTLLMPILAAAAMGAGTDPKLFMVPAALSASCAFMLPVATPPNVITFSTGRFSVRTMAREGFALNLFGVIVISIGCFLLLT